MESRGGAPSGKRGRGFRGRGKKPWIPWRMINGKKKKSQNEYLLENKGNGDSHSNDGESPFKKRKLKGRFMGCISEPLRRKYPGIHLYFHSELPRISQWEVKVQVVIDYLQRIGYSSKNSVMKIEEDEYFSVSYEHLLKDAEVSINWSDFDEDLNSYPEEVLNIFGLAMHQTLHNFICNDEELMVDSQISSQNCDIEGSPELDIPRIKAGIMKLDPIIPLMDIKSSLLGRFITIRGAVVRTGNIKPICVRMCFQCMVCDGTFVLEQPDGQFKMPKECMSSDGCQNTNQFEILEGDERTRLLDCRKIRIQDIQHSDADRGVVPRTIDCELFSSLVNICNAGDAVSLTGIVKMTKELRFTGEQSLHNIYLEVVAVRNHKEFERTMGGNWFSFSNLDFYAVKELYETEKIFRLLIASLCPSIYGNELVKAGLLLSLFGGSSQEENIINRRSNINLLMVGDPGIGKSQMLRAANDVAPRGVYVCGTGATVAGLTVTLNKDGDDYSLEAGALVMSDRGVCCIDEFDKMHAQHHALLEAMEQMSISVAKSGVYRTLPARSTVIAAANPVGGHYDVRKTVNENIKISPALLSRFDLIFIMLDRPNKEFDRRMTEYLMEIEKYPFRASQVSQMARDGCNVKNSDHSHKLPLIERIKFDPNEEVDLVPHKLLRKYIAYARQYVNPKISPEAAVVLKEYYLKLRVKNRMINSTPVTTRQLESLVRLTEARAKLELREVATAEDANDILEIFEYSLSSAFDEDLVALSALSQEIIPPSLLSQTKSQTRAGAKRLVIALQSYAQKQSKNILSVEEIKSIGSALGLRSVLNNLICSLNNEGFLLKKSGDMYKLQTIDI